MQMSRIGEVQVLAKDVTINADTEVLISGLRGNVDFNEWTLVCEASAVTATGSVILNVYTNQTGGAVTETVKAPAITLAAAGTATYTFPDPTTRKMPAQYIIVGVEGSGLAAPVPGPEVAVTYSVYLVRRV